MENTAIRFSCNGCGVCCKGRLIPLTLQECREWLGRGHDVAVLVEAFDEFHWPAEPAKFSHNSKRSVLVNSGRHRINVIPIFAANALSQCPNLDTQNMCGIYDQRPLVCRIYPSEISPFIDLDPVNKVCPPEVWEAGDIIFSDRVTEPVMAEQIEASRSADRADAQAKVAICESMGMTVAAWKENAFAVYLPSKVELAEAIQRLDSNSLPANPVSWRVRIEDDELNEAVSARGVLIDVNDSPAYIFHRA